MTPKQLEYLRYVTKSNILVHAKQNNTDINELIVFLKSYKIISKKENSNSFEISDGVMFDKLLELKSIDEFKLWYSQKDKNTFNNDFRNSTIGQVNQSSTVFGDTKLNNRTDSSKVALKNGFMLKFWKLISENKLISSIIMLIIIFLLKKYYNIDLG
ncbi:hypothetical protein [Tenacibaculum retecalamus]|uniref:hypothetical protein n=1 Tax=Tenacibaculum retecalamus TaxID=3018315 RepID=UPI0023D94534|nr:hypothetical protein [Tenacibaculum retecalamus]WBX71786.1 hypothetical protein PG912_03095 [Tenacibaculum retecalamus]